MELIDLSQELFPGIPAFEDHPSYAMEIAVTHQQRQNLPESAGKSPVVHKITITEHTGTHVDAYNHMGIPFEGRSVEAMPLDRFYTRGLCLDFSNKGLMETITPEELEEALKRENLEIRENDTVLLYTDHFRRYFGSDQWNNGPGITPEAALWFARKKVAAFGVETRSPGILGKGNKEIHTICGEENYTHYENLINLHKLIGRGYFRFIAFPLRIKGGTGSPVRAVAVFE